MRLLRLARLCFSALILICGLAIRAAAQDRAAFVPLRADGNGIERLRENYSFPFKGTVSEGIRAIALRAHLDVSFDESLPGLSSIASTPDSSMSAAAIILRFADAGGLAARVSASGQLVIVKRVVRDSRRRQITGFVRDSTTGEPLGDVRVNIAGASAMTSSRSDGSFSVAADDAGARSITFTRIGYRPMKVIVGNESNAPVNVRMSQAIIALAAVRVSPGQFGVMEQGVGAGHTLSREQIRTNPQLGEDIFRAVNRLPGLAANDMSAKFFVRGGSGDELYVSLDGAELLEPFHLKDVDAALSIVDIESVGGIDLSTGGFSADYGNRLTGVFKMSSIEPRSDGARTAVGLSVTNVRMMSQGRFAGNKGGWVASVRRGYLDLALRLSNSDDSLKPRYYDAFAKVQYDVSPSQRIAVHVLDAGDRLKYLQRNEPSLRSSYGTSYAWLTWDTGMGSRFSTSTVASVARLTWNRAGGAPDNTGAEALNVRDDRRYNFASIKASGSLSLSEHAMIRAGGEVKNESASYAYQSRVGHTEFIETAPNHFTDTTIFEGSPSRTSSSVFTSARVAISSLVVEGGARLDHQTRNTAATQLSPRLSAVWTPLPETSIRGAWGFYFQPQPLYALQVQDGVFDFGQAERAEHRTIGIEQKLPRSLALRVELYQRLLSRQRPRFLNALNSLDVFPEVTGDRLRFDASTGEARGFETRISPSRRRLFDWSATYTLARVFDNAGSIEVPRVIDQRHTFSLEASRRASSGKWLVSGAWLYHSGWAYTPTFFRMDTVVATPTTILVNISSRLGELNSGRLPSYYRLDLRATRFFDVGRGRIALFADIFNVLNRQNARGYGYDLKFKPLRIVRLVDSQVPRLPTAGVTWEF